MQKTSLDVMQDKSPNMLTENCFRTSKLPTAEKFFSVGSVSCLAVQMLRSDAKTPVSIEGCVLRLKQTPPSNIQAVLCVSCDFLRQTIILQMLHCPGAMFTRATMVDSNLPPNHAHSTLGHRHIHNVSMLAVNHGKVSRKRVTRGKGWNQLRL